MGSNLSDIFYIQRCRNHRRCGQWPRITLFHIIHTFWRLEPQHQGRFEFALGPSDALAAAPFEACHCCYLLEKAKGATMFKIERHKLQT